MRQTAKRNVRYTYKYRKFLIYAECTAGYFGTFCNESCPPGRFGNRCGGRCYPKCTDEYCNHVSGCHLIIKNTIQLTVSGKEN